QQNACYVIRQISAVSLSVSLDSTTIGWERVSILLHTSPSCRGEQRNRIDDGSKAQLKLLFRSHGRRVPVISAVKVREDAPEALPYRDLHLLLRQLLLVFTHRHVACPAEN